MGTRTITGSETVYDFLYGNLSRFPDDENRGGSYDYDFDAFTAMYNAPTGDGGVQGAQVSTGTSLSTAYANDNSIHAADCTLPFQNTKFNKRALWLVFGV